MAYGHWMKSPDPRLIQILVTPAFLRVPKLALSAAEGCPLWLKHLGAAKKCSLRPAVSTGLWSILRTSSNFFVWGNAFMASNAVEPVPDQVPADDFQALEEKIYRTIEMYKAARQAQASAERDAQRLRQQMEDREEELVRLRRETVQLKKEREDIRGRVEKMLAQIESLAEAS